MAKPLRSDNPAPQSVQFKHFGVLNDGQQSKGAFTTSIVTNVIIALLVILVGSVVKTNVVDVKKKELTYAEIPKEPPPPPPPPPPKLPPPPPPKLKLEPPKIKMPDPEKLPEIKPVEIKMAPVAVKLPPAPPKEVKAPPAPVVVKLAPPTAASVPNHDAHPTAIRLGSQTNPLKPMTGPAVSAVNLGVAGSPGMPPGNTGSGKPSPVAIAGSGAPNGSDLNGRGRGPVAIKGFSDGIPGGQGKTQNHSTSPVAVNITQAPVQTATARPTVQTAAVASPPKVTYKPKPAYTEEAKALHLEGAVSIRIHVNTSGGVQVIAVTRSLGHGLDQSAIQAIQGTRFTPALDSNGRPIDWEGVVNVNFQMAG